MSHRLRTLYAHEIERCDVCHVWFPGTEAGRIELEGASLVACPGCALDVLPDLFRGLDFVDLSAWSPPSGYPLQVAEDNPDHWTNRPIPYELTGKEVE